MKTPGKARGRAPGLAAWIRRWAWLLLPFGLAGCAVGDAVVGATIGAADSADAARVRSRGNRLLAE